MTVLPMLFRPLFKDRIWGGTRLARVLGKAVPAGRRVGESWELVDLEDDRTPIAAGAMAGLTLRQAAERLGSALVGVLRYEPPFPIQTRYIDAGDILSVQVHPGPEACRVLGKGAPKAESWFIIDADPGAFLYKGLRPGTDERLLRAALRDGSVADLLVKVPVRAGECHHIPAGTVHAIGPGILIAEVQTPSDTTFRLHDWDRRDRSGRPRELHVEDALASIRWGITAEDLRATTRGRLVQESTYAVDLRLVGPGESARLGRADMPVVMTVVAGAATIPGSGAADDVACRLGDTLLVPAQFEGQLVTRGGCSFLESTIVGAD